MEEGSIKDLSNYRLEKAKKNLAVVSSLLEDVERFLNETDI